MLTVTWGSLGVRKVVLGDEEKTQFCVWPCAGCEDSNRSFSLFLPK